MAAECFRVETRRTTLSPGRWVRTFVANAATAALALQTLNWPPTDVVVVDRMTGTDRRRWQEYGSGAALLVEQLNEDIGTMDLVAFAEKWDVPVT